mgnify:CR=1 FL=1
MNPPQQALTQPTTLKLISLNVQKLGSAAKLAATLQWARNSQYHILLMQETGKAEALLPQLRKLVSGSPDAWPGHMFWCPGASPQSGGCLTLIKLHPAISAVDALDRPAFSDPHGRFLRVDLCIGGTPTSLVNVYGPPGATVSEREAFFARLGSALDGQRRLLMGGDWNLVLSPLDIVRADQDSQAASNRTAGSQHLQTLMDSQGLTDVWRQRHGVEREFTHWSAAARSGARLDRWLVSAAAAQAWSARSTVEPSSEGPTSDHLPVSLDLSIPLARPPKGHPVRTAPFALWMLDDEAFTSTVNSILAEAQADAERAAAAEDGGQPAQWASCMARWLAVKDRVASTCNATKKNRHSDSKRAVAVAALKAHRTRATLCGNPGDATALAAWQEATAALHALHRQQLQNESTARAVLDQVYGDSSTFWFHRALTPPHPPTRIPALRPGPAEPPSPTRHTLDTVEGIRAAHAICLEHFSGDSPTGIFNPRPSNPQQRALLLQPFRNRTAPTLSPTAAADCEGPSRDGLISGPELHEALRQSSRGRSPGLDGLPYEFYSAFWASIEPLLVAAFNEAYGSQAPDALHPLLAGLITLLHKGEGKPLDHLTGYRPITLLNCDLKILCKAIANRLHIPLDHLIDPSQSAFICGRDISDSLLTHQCLAEHLQRQGHGLWMLMCDLASAYDRVNWDFMRDTMIAMGFRETGHVRWALLLHLGGSCTVLLNGHASPFFPRKCGLAQGSGLSPLLWCIVLQPLMVQLSSLTSSGRISTARMPDDSPAPDNTTHADDSDLYLTDPTSEQVGAAIAAYDSFHAASGVGRAAGKGGLHEEVRASDQAAADSQLAEAQSTAAQFGLKLTRQEESQRKLGIPTLVDNTAAAATAFSNCHGKLWARMRPWQGLSISLWGRVLVAKSHLASKLVFQASFLQPTATHLQAAQRAIRCFVASPSTPGEDSHPSQLHPSEIVCSLPRHLGGLAYPILSQQVSSLQAKPICSLFSYPSKPWKTLTQHALATADQAAGLSTWAITLAPAPANSTAGRARRQLTSRLSPRMQAQVTALVATAPHRIKTPAEQGFYSAMAEPLFYNARFSITTDTGQRLLTPADLPDPVRPDTAAAGRGWRHLRDVWQAVRAGALTPAQQQGVATIRAAAPPEWASFLDTEGQPAAEWVCLQGVDKVWYALEGPLGLGSRATSPRSLYRANTAGRLLPLCPDWVGQGEEPPEDVHDAIRTAEAILATSPGPWKPAAVLRSPKPRQLWTATDQQKVQEAAEAAAAVGEAGAVSWQPDCLWLLGPWDCVPLDPTVWGHGERSLPAYTAKAGRERITLLEAAKDSSIGEIGIAEGVRPKLWPVSTEGGASGLQQLEASWQQAYEARRAQRSSQQAGPSAADREQATNDYLSVSSRWVDLQRPRSQRPPPTPRGSQGGAGPSHPHPSQQPQEPLNQPQQPSQDQEPSLDQPASHPAPWDDSKDPLGHLGQQNQRQQQQPQAAASQQQAAAETSLAAWRRLHRDPISGGGHKATAFRLLHGSLRVRAYALYTTPGSPHSSGHCPYPSCSRGGGSGCLETLTHAFLECPAAAPVITWTQQLWAAATASAPPPRDGALLLGDYRGGWQPPDQHAALWQALRTTTIGRVWQQRTLISTAAAMGWRATEAATRTAQLVVDDLAAAMRRDWLRATADVRKLSPQACGSWFRGRDPSMPEERFTATWGPAGSLYSIEGGNLVVRLSYAHPVPVPQPPPPPAAAAAAAPPQQGGPSNQQRQQPRQGARAPAAAPQAPAASSPGRGAPNSQQEQEHGARATAAAAAPSLGGAPSSQQEHEHSARAAAAAAAAPSLGGAPSSQQEHEHSARAAAAAAAATSLGGAPSSQQEQQHSARMATAAPSPGGAPSSQQEQEHSARAAAAAAAAASLGGAQSGKRKRPQQQRPCKPARLNTQSPAAATAQAAATAAPPADGKPPRPQGEHPSHQPAAEEAAALATSAAAGANVNSVSKRRRTAAPAHTPATPLAAGAASATPLQIEAPAGGASTTARGARSTAGAAPALAPSLGPAEPNPAFSNPKRPRPLGAPPSQPAAEEAAALATSAAAGANVNSVSKRRRTAAPAHTPATPLAAGAASAAPLQIEASAGGAPTTTRAARTKAGGAPTTPQDPQPPPAPLSFAAQMALTLEDLNTRPARRGMRPTPHLHPTLGGAGSHTGGQQP